MAPRIKKTNKTKLNESERFEDLQISKSKARNKELFLDALVQNV